MIVPWKSHLITKVEFNRKHDEYHLLDEDDYIVDTLKRHEFLSFPQLRNLPNGRHRRTNPQNHGSATNATAAGGGISLSIAQYTALIASRQSLTAKQIAAAIRRMNQQLQHAMLYGSGPSTSLHPRWSGEPKPKPPLKREGIIPGEIVGYRCWRIEQGTLCSVYQSDIWLPNSVLEGRELGDWDSRGIHAWKDPASEDYHSYIRAYLNHEALDWSAMIMAGRQIPRRPAMATGTVFLWGDVVEHQRGYRAEFARVRSLDWLYPDASMMGREQEVLNKLRAVYHV